MNRNMATPVTHQSIYEGNAPRMLFWSLDQLSPYRLPEPTDFMIVNGRCVFGSADSRNEPKPFASRSAPWLLIEYENVDFSQTREGDTDLFQWKTPSGVLSARRQSNHMIEFPVKSIADIHLWSEVQKALRYRKNPAYSREQGQSSWSVMWKWSPVQELLQFVTGVENFYYMLMDAPESMKSLLETMHTANIEALKIGFEANPGATVLRLIENTSSQIISPDFYHELTVPHVRAYADMAHERGMKCNVHMCGCLTALFDGIEATGIDGIHSVTPPPIGDSHYLAVRERFGDEFVIIGRLNAQLFLGKTRDCILATLREMIPDNLVQTPFALWITTDDMQPSEDDVHALIAALDMWNRQYDSATNVNEVRNDPNEGVQATLDSAPDS